MTRALALFDEVCIVGAKFEVRVVVTANPAGILVGAIDEKDGTGPTFAQLQGKPHIEILLNQNIDKKYSVSWKAQDYLDLQFQASAVALNPPAWFKLVASNASTGTNAAGTFQMTVTGSLALCFRGYA
jgi:hypothetical protein